MYSAITSLEVYTKLGLEFTVFALNRYTYAILELGLPILLRTSTV